MSEAPLTSVQKLNLDRTSLQSTTTSCSSITTTALYYKNSRDLRLDSLEIGNTNNNNDGSIDQQPYDYNSLIESHPLDDVEPEGSSISYTKPPPPPMM